MNIMKISLISLNEIENKTLDNLGIHQIASEYNLNIINTGLIKKNFEMLKELNFQNLLNDFYET